MEEIDTGVRVTRAAVERRGLRHGPPPTRGGTAVSPRAGTRKGTGKHDGHGRTESLGAVVELLYLAVMGTACAYAAALYMGLSPGYTLGLVCAAVIFAVYGLNRFTDITEDFANDTGKMMFFAARRGIMAMAVLALCGAIVLLAVLERLNVYYSIVVSLGIAYSFRLIPWYRRGEGVVFLRLKEIPLVKNLVVSMLWGVSVFAVPLVFARGRFVPAELAPVAVLIAALVVSTLNSTVFCDILDRTGDLLARNRTLPVLLGNAGTARLLLAVDLGWLAVVLLLTVTSAVGAAQCGLLAAMALYPLTYLAAYRWGRLRRRVVRLMAEGDLFVFAGGMLLLAGLG